VDVHAWWIAPLFAVITATTCCTSTHPVQNRDFRAAEQATLPQQRPQATVKCLDAGSYVIDLSTLSRQAFAMLTMSVHLSGSSNRQAIFRAPVTRIAQSVGLNRPDATSDRTIEVESGRRLWSPLCSQDRLSIMFFECYMISPLHTSPTPPDVRIPAPETRNAFRCRRLRCSADEWAPIMFIVPSSHCEEKCPSILSYATNYLTDSVQRRFLQLKIFTVS
jgi:hypothetical protein